LKFLGLRLCEHDSNISYYTGEEVLYYKLERHTQKKYDAYNNFELWIDDIKKIWGVTPNDFEEIGIVFDPWAYKLKDQFFFPETTFKYLPYNMTRINHHYAHALSSWPLYEECNTHFVFDAEGDLNIGWTVFKNNKIYDIGYLDKKESVGKAYNNACYFLGIEGAGGLNAAGKLMGLQSYGKLDEEYLSKIKNFTLKNVDVIFNFSLYEQHVGDKLLASHKKLDWIHTIHFYMSSVMVNFFKEVVDNENDYITYSGGVAQNVVWNTSLKKQFPNLVIPPYCGDEGLSLGIVEYLRLKHKQPKGVLNEYML
jgi:carbamoyltransferase|tara:strand:- start:5139 stop:6068 length:930 start_codon:yes stop_codon:yes gene_type:complete